MVTIFSTRNSLNEKKEEELSDADIAFFNSNNGFFTTYESPRATGHYSKSVVTGDLVFCSGQIPLNPETMNIIYGTIEDQTRQVCRNIKGLLAEHSLGLKDVVKTTVYLTDLANFEKVNNIYKEYFLLKPARSLIGVAALPKGATIMIEAIAKIPYKPQH